MLTNRQGFPSTISAQMKMLISIVFQPSSGILVSSIDGKRLFGVLIPVVDMIEKCGRGCGRLNFVRVCA